MSAADMVVVAMVSGMLNALLAVLEQPGAAVPELNQLRNVIADWKEKLDELRSDNTRGRQ